MGNVLDKVFDYGGGDVFGLAFAWTNTVAIYRADKLGPDTVRVRFSGPIDTGTVGTADFAIVGNTVSGVDAQSLYVDVTFVNPVNVGDTITASVSDGIDEADGDPVGETTLAVTSSSSPLLIPGLGLGGQGVLTIG